MEVRDRASHGRRSQLDHRLESAIHTTGAAEDLDDSDDTGRQMDRDLAIVVATKDRADQLVSQLRLEDAVPD